MKKILSAVFLICCGVHGGIAATCSAGNYLLDGSCTPCGSGQYYCPGDDQRYNCPSASGRLNSDWPSSYYNPTIVSTYIYIDSIAEYNDYTSVSQCALYYSLSNSYGTMYSIRRYTASTDKYDRNVTGYWTGVNSGYYLMSPRICGTWAYYSSFSSCDAGGYCPGNGPTKCSSSNTSSLGLNVCGDNSYSDAGASSCTPCPAGTGNSGSNLSDHAGVSSCKTISCPAGQEVVNYTCTACKAGYYKSSAGSASCTQCSDYKYASGTGNTTCIYPPAGYNSNGCSGGKGCTGQEACGSSWYCPGDGRYYSCPSNSTARTNTSTSADDCLCNSGYVKRSGECKQLCTAGFTTLNSNGVTVNAYSEKLTTPSINISANGTTCYVPLATGSASGAINVSYDSKTYHTVN